MLHLLDNLPATVPSSSSLFRSQIICCQPASTHMALRPRNSYSHSDGPSCEIWRSCPHPTKPAVVQQCASMERYLWSSSGPRPRRERPKFYGSSATTNILTVGVKDHARFRRTMAHAFPEKALREQQPLIQTYVDRLMLRLRKEAAKRAQIDIVTWFNFIAFDLISDLAFGGSFDCLENTAYHPWIELIFGSMKASVMITAVGAFPGSSPCFGD